MDAALADDLKARVREALPNLPSPEAFAATLEWRMRLFALLQISDVLCLMFCPWPAVTAVVAVLFACYRARTVWTIIHNRVHAPPLRNTPAKLFYDFCTGFIAVWWRDHHLAHHAHTNTVADPDTRLFLWRDMNDVREPGRGARGARFVTTLAQYPFMFVLFFVRSLASYRGNAAVFVVLMASYGVLLNLLLPAEVAAFNTTVNMGIGTLYILATFAPTHTASRANFTLSGERIADQIVSTNDVWPDSRLWTWLCGGINAHIEHHLFPHLPSDVLADVAPTIRAYAAERGLPYNAYSPLGLWRAHLAFLASF